jgi:hypothetical protein
MSWLYIYFADYKNVRASGEKGATARVEIDQETHAILLIIVIVYEVCRFVIKSVQQCTYFLFLCIFF